MPTDLHVGDEELRWLDFYRASELHGGLVLGRLALRVRDPRLMVRLTRHAAEEVVHSRLWAETIVAVGGKPRPVRHTYQQLYAREIGRVTSLVEVLALTQVFEQRVCRHFSVHARLPGTHPEIVETLQRMIDEEDSHLSWVKAWLDEREADGYDVPSLMNEYRAVDGRIYGKLTAEYEFPSVSDATAGTLRQ